MISIASPVFPKMKFEYKNIEYGYVSIPMFDFPSIHLKGTKDNYLTQLTCDKHFKPESNPLVVTFEDGHRFPRCLSDEGFTVLKNFVKAQFINKNGDETGIEIDYERYNFDVKF